ncbi:MAG: 4'-phosphopantetheinyl transferase superfamily protein [Cyclobacteriaceae bacterium]|nr:4'-phosphopantetheinyl transferase superfamily protein [Cyclobacteriaceae bacterium]
MYDIFVGNDIEQIERIERLFLLKPHLLKKMFYFSEWKYANKKANPSSTLTGIWCAKEAVLKSFSPRLQVSIPEIEITYSQHGFPTPVIHKKSISEISFLVSVSISHSKEYAMATAILKLEL